MTIFIWIIGIILGVFFLFYLLYAIGKSTENFKAYFPEYFTPIFIGAVILFMVVIPQVSNALRYINTKEDMRSLSNIYDFCSSQTTPKEKKNSFRYPQLKNYSFKPKSFICNGDENNLISAKSSDESIYPSYSINVSTGEWSCFYNGSDERFPSCNKGK